MWLSSRLQALRWLGFVIGLRAVRYVILPDRQGRGLVRRSIPLAAPPGVDRPGPVHLPDFTAHNLCPTPMYQAGFQALRRQAPSRRPWIPFRAGWAGWHSSNDPLRPVDARTQHPPEAREALALTPGPRIVVV